MDDVLFTQSQSLARFDRQQTEGRDPPPNVGRATAEFGASLDRHVAEVVAAAGARAAELEREAERYAATKRHESEATAQKMLDSALTRAARVLDSIGLVESALGGMMETLRSEFTELVPSTSRQTAPRGETLSGEPSSKKTMPEAVSAPSEPEPSPPQPAEEPLPSLQPREPARNDEQPKEEQRPRTIQPSVELDNLIRAQVKEMVATGKPRAQVERFVGRFPHGDDYVGMLDHLYKTTQRPPRRRFLAGLRRRAR